MSKWNERQAEAISARGRSVVVSAAAGSGKTSVLSERVLRLIEEGEDLSRMLIVTFTNLAAGEMKERIARRLSEEGSDPRIAAQAEKCAFADISTIHAFCGRVIRDNFTQAGVSPSFTVASDAQSVMLRMNAIDDAVQRAAEDESLRPFFRKFAQRGDLQYIKDIVFNIYFRVISLKEPQSWLDAALSNHSSPEFIDVLFGEYQTMVREAAAKASLELAQRSQLWAESGFDSEACESENTRIEMLSAAKSLNIACVCLPRIDQITSKAKGAPNGKSKTYTNRANKYFAELLAWEGDFAAKVKSELASTGGDAQALINITRTFMERYADLKRARGVLDNDDLIHFALKVLRCPDIARRYREKYAHVFVDEYQDINEAQSAIINSVLRGGNDFFVGDVKQCIYMFRESSPSLLISRCEELRGSGLVEMNTNYRSCPPVVDFINGVMKHMMNPESGGVEYAGGHTLSAGCEGEGFAEVILAGGEGDSLSSEGEGIAACIKQLHSEGYSYKDIAVLRPEVSNSGARLSRILSDAGIPVISGFEGEDRKFGELAVFLNLLSVIDSPTSDTAILSVMRYPHFGFTEKELAAIRLAYDKNAADQSFCAAVLSYSEDSALGHKVSSFLSEIEHYRLLSRCLKLPDFLMRLRQEAELSEYALTSPGGAGSDAAIGAFISAACAINGTSLSDLPEIAQRMKASAGAQRPGDDDAVYLTTIHKSKGLEFPAVILSGMHKKIDQRDSSGVVLVGRALGLALDAVDAGEHTRRPTLHRRAVARAMRAESISETVRLMYVGMTRAKQRLAILGTGGELRDKWTEAKPRGWQHGASTYFDLVMPALAMMCREEGKDLGEFTRIVLADSITAEKPDKQQCLNTLMEAVKSASEPDIFTEYAYSSDLGVPSKVSVSALKRLGEEHTPFIRPALPPSEGITAAERGTLMHKVLQKTGMAMLEADEVRRCVNELEKQNIIGEGYSEYVNEEQISAFLHDPLAQRARESERLLLEAPFCIQASAKELSLAASDEMVMVQGVIDMCFLENRQWVIVDYKTDRVSKASLKEAAEKYRIQLSLYQKALEGITGMSVKEKYIYFLTLNETVKIY